MIEIMDFKLSHKLLSLIGAIAAFVVVSANTACANEAEIRTTESLAIGMTHDQVIEIFAFEQTVDISQEFKAVVIRPEEFGVESLLIFKNDILISKELSGHRWVTMQPLNVDGMPALIASEWSGGAHCCFTYFLIALEPMPKVTQTLDLSDGQGNLKTCGELICLDFFDYTFAYWRGPFVDSIGAPIITSLRDGRFNFDFDLMRKPYVEVSDKTISKIKQAFFKAEQGEDIGIAYRMLSQELLNLIYSGHADRTSALLKRVWTQNTVSSTQHSFEIEFITELKKSQYWADLLKLNGGRILGAK